MTGSQRIRVMYWKTRNVQVVLKRCKDMAAAIDFKIDYDGPLDRNRIYTEVRPRVRNVFPTRIKRARSRKSVERKIEADFG